MFGLFLQFRKNLLSFNKRCHINFVQNQFSQCLVETLNTVVFDIRKSEMLWKRQRCPEKFYNYLHECFLRNKDSSSYIVNLLRFACDHNTCSSDLVYNMITAYNQYVNTYSVQFVPTKEQKAEILKSVLQYRSYQLLKHACETFKITEEQKSSFKEFISNLLQQEKLAEAVYCISVLKMRDEYRIEEIVLLLLYEGKWKTAMSLLRNCPDLQRETANVLDNLLKTSGDTIPMSVRNKQILKALSSLVRAFKIPPEECKNLHFVRSRGAINLLIRRREQQSITDTAWEEMILKIVGDNRSLKDHLLYKLVTRGDEESALKMKEKLNIEDFDFSTIPVTRIAGASSENEMDDEDLHLEDDNDHLNFNLSLSDISFVDTKQKFLDCIDDLCKNYYMIGIDSEWKPQFGLSQDRLSLVQLAVHNKVYILDMISLTDCLDIEDWDKLMDDIFGSSKIIKLGCGILTDIQKIVENNKGTKGKTVRFSHMLDIAVFYQKLQEVYPTEMNNGGSLKGLSNLCKIILGKPLNKEERLCDWEKRPLKDSQLEYAALDAYCLLQIYDELKKTAQEKNINFDHMTKVAMVLTASVWKPKKNLRKDKNGNNIHIPKYIFMQQFKVAVHAQFHEQGKQLSQLGADVLFLNESNKASDAALISRSQERILICSEEFKYKVCNISSDVLCFVPSSDTGCQPFIFEILQKYNIHLNVKRIFQHCPICNSLESLQLSKEELNLVKEQERNIQNCTISGDKKSSKYLYGSLQRTISDMINSGVQIDVKDQLFNLSQNVFLCVKCGHVQS